MKRIYSACLEQTIHFQLKEDVIGHAAAARAVVEEVAQYKAQLDKKHVEYRVLEETKQPDDSIVLKIKRQYNNYSTGDYLK